MFEVGFSEMLVITIVALVVLGPAKLPRLVAQIGRWMGRARAMARQFREQLEDEISLEDPSQSPQSKAWESRAWDPTPPPAPIDSNDTGHSDLSTPVPPADPLAKPPHERGP